MPVSRSEELRLMLTHVTRPIRTTTLWSITWLAHRVAWGSRSLRSCRGIPQVQPDWPGAGHFPGGGRRLVDPSATHFSLA